MHQLYYQLKQEQINNPMNDMLVWSSQVFCYVNVFLLLLAWMLMIVIAQHDSICFDSRHPTNLFILDQFG